MGEWTSIIHLRFQLSTILTFDFTGSTTLPISHAWFFFFFFFFPKPQKRRLCERTTNFNEKKGQFAHHFTSHLARCRLVLKLKAFFFFFFFFFFLFLILPKSSPTRTESTNQTHINSSIIFNTNELDSRNIVNFTWIHVTKIRMLLLLVSM